MSEYADHILSAIDNCYEMLKKKKQPFAEKTKNPFLLFEGKQQERVCCKCGKIQQSMVDKPTTFQTSYITLTTALYPITSIRFETRDYTVRYFTNTNTNININTNTNINIIHSYSHSIGGDEQAIHHLGADL